MFGLGLGVIGLVGLRFALSRARRGNEWLAREGAPWVLRRAKLFLCEPKNPIFCTSPIPLHGRPDLVYKSRMRGLIVVDTKTRMREEYYAQDIVEMSAYKYILEHGYGRRVSSHGYIRLVVGEYQPTVRYVKVRLLSARAVEHLARDYQAIRNGEYTPACLCGHCK